MSNSLFEESSCDGYSFLDIYLNQSREVDLEPPMLYRRDSAPRSAEVRCKIPMTIGTVIHQIKKQKKIGGKKKRSTKRNIAAEYRKNICGYVTKKVIREFINDTYKKKVEDLCSIYGANYGSARNMYIQKIEQVTGPSHIPLLFECPKWDSKGNVKVFLEFFKWFLRERYVRHLFTEGKMEQKNAYIEYKNKELIPMIAQIEKGIIEEQSSPAHNLCFEDITFTL